jgi:3',5'-cyclic-AMP phosphodiesterase
LLLKQLTAHDFEKIRIVQITDTHLFADKDKSLLGINTWNSFTAVTNLIWQQESVKTSPMDLLLCTGDIAQDYSEASYLNFKNHMAFVNAPLAALAGNHDEAERLSNTGMSKHKVIHIGAWCVLLVDSQVPYKSHGKIAPEELTWLETQLIENKDKHILVATHHHPQSLSTQWLDGVGMLNGDQFIEVLSKYSAVKAVLLGHVHQEVDYEYEHFRVLASPSTCIQFKPQSEEFMLDDTQPGYRSLELLSNGEIETQVHRIADRSFLPDMNAEGY